MVGKRASSSDDQLFFSMPDNAQPEQYSLPDAQGQRVFEHYLLNHSVKAIAAAEGVTERAINAAIQRGLENMKKYLEKVL